MQIKRFDTDNKVVEIVFFGKTDFEHIKRLIKGLDDQNFYFANDLLPKFNKNFKPNKHNEMTIKLNACYFTCFCLCLERCNEKYIIADVELHQLMLDANKLVQKQQQTFLLN